MLFLFFSHSFSLEDVVVRRLLNNNPNFFGEWEYTGNSYINNNEIFFLNQEKTTAGLYFSQKLPQNQWNTTICFEFPNVSHPIQLGIWVTKDFGPEGYIFGGPLQFTGFALLIAKLHNQILIEVRENDSRSKLTSLFQPQTNLTLDDSENVSFSIDFHKNKRTTINLINNNKSFTIFDDILRIEVKKYWFGITGISSKFTEENISVTEEIDSQTNINTSSDDSHAIIIKSIQFSSNSSSLKQPILPSFEFGENFDYNFSKKEKSQRSVYQTTAMDVMIEIERMVKYSKILSSTNFVQNMIYNQMFGVSDAWQRRSIKMMKETSGLRENITALMRNTSKIIENIGNEIENDLVDLMKNINNVTAKLYYTIFYETDIEDAMNEHIEIFHGKGVTKMLFYSSIVELLICVFVLLCKIHV